MQVYRNDPAIAERREREWQERRAQWSRSLERIAAETSYPPIQALVTDGLALEAGEVLGVQVDVVVIEYKDRLARFGYRYLERYITDFGAELEAVEDQTPNGNTHEELVKDLIAIVTSFSARVYGARGAKVVKKVKEALRDEDDHSDPDS